MMKLTSDQQAKLDSIKAAGETGVLAISSVSADSLVRKGLVRREVSQSNVRATHVGALLNLADFGTRSDLYTFRGKMRFYTIYRYVAV